MKVNNANDCVAVSHPYTPPARCPCSDDACCVEYPYYCY